jgi:hypothetical protein
MTPNFHNHRYDPHHFKCLRTASQRLLAAIQREHGELVYALTHASHKGFR